MTTQEVANAFNDMAQNGLWHVIQNELYSPDAVSIEPEISPGLPSVQGLDAIKAKGELFGQMIEEMHGAYCNPPQVAGTHFSVAMGLDLTMKTYGRVNLDEIAVYEVKDGKIVKEQFFYTM